MTACLRSSFPPTVISRTLEKVNRLSQGGRVPPPHGWIPPLWAQARLMQCWDVLERAAATPLLQPVKDAALIFSLLKKKFTSLSFFLPLHPTTAPSLLSHCSTWTMLPNWFFQAIKMLLMTAISTIILHDQSVRMIYFRPIQRKLTSKLCLPTSTTVNYSTFSIWFRTQTKNGTALFL